MAPTDPITDPTEMLVRKKFREYCFDFIAAAAAIALTFGGTLLIEYRQDRAKEVEYMRAMIDDLREDIKNCYIYSAHKNEQVEDCKFVSAWLAGKKIAANTKELYYNGRMVVPKYAFWMTDATLQQLKGGGFRLIHHPHIVSDILAYTLQYNGILALQTLEDSQKDDYRRACAKVFDAKIFYSMLDLGKWEINPPNNNPKLFSNRAQDINELLMMVHMIERNEHTESETLQDLAKLAQGLIDQIQKEYNL